MTKDNVIGKVEKLLRLGDNNSSEAEAKAAILKARKLMAEHNIKMAELYIDEQKEEIVRDDTILQYGVAWWHLDLHNIIASNFRCESITGLRYESRFDTRRKRKLWLLGYKTDVAIATEVFFYAVESVTYNANRYEYLNGKSGKKSYIAGYVMGIKKALEMQTEKLSSETALVLVTPQEVKDELYNICKGKTHNRKVGNIHDMSARVAGFEDGKRFNPHMKMLEEA